MYTTSRFTKLKLLKPGLKLIGAKSKVRDLLYVFEPGGVTTYVEPFLGSGAILMGKEPHAEEYVSDINDVLIAFFRNMQRDPDRLWKEIQGCLEVVVSLVEQEGTEGWKKFTRLEPRRRGPSWSAWFYCVTKLAMNGIFRRRGGNGPCNSSWCQTTKGRGLYTREWFDAVYKRIKNVRFYMAEYRALLELVNRPDAWVVLDPPYRDCLTTYNGISFDDAAHVELRDALRVSRSKWLLTINDDPFVRDLYTGFNLVPHGVFYSCSQTVAGRSMRPELIITNYDIEEPLYTLRDYLGQFQEAV